MPAIASRSFWRRLLRIAALLPLSLHGTFALANQCKLQISTTVTSVNCPGTCKFCILYAPMEGDCLDLDWPPLQCKTDASYAMPGATSTCSMQYMCLSDSKVLMIPGWRTSKTDNNMVYPSGVTNITWMYNGGNMLLFEDSSMFHIPDSVDSFGIDNIELGNQLDSVRVNPHVTYLRLTRLKLAHAPTFLSSMPNLVNMSLAANELTSFPAYPSLQKLVRLNLNSNPFITFPPSVAGLKSLKDLSMTGTKIADMHVNQSIYDALAKIPKLDLDFSVMHCRDGYSEKTLGAAHVCVQNASQTTDPPSSIPVPVPIHDNHTVVIVGVSVAVAVAVCAAIVYAVIRRKRTQVPEARVIALEETSVHDPCQPTAPYMPFPQATVQPKPVNVWSEPDELPDHSKAGQIKQTHPSPQGINTEIRVGH